MILILIIASCSWFNIILIPNLGLPNNPKKKTTQHCHPHVIKPVVKVAQSFQLGVLSQTWWIAQGRRGRDIFESKGSTREHLEANGGRNWKLYLENRYKCTTCCVQSDEVGKHDSSWLLNGQLGSKAFRPRVRVLGKLYLNKTLEGTAAIC